LATTLTRSLGKPSRSSCPAAKWLGVTNRSTAANTAGWCSASAAV
jgi:hypothetical protein